MESAYVIILTDHDINVVSIQNSFYQWIVLKKM